MYINSVMFNITQKANHLCSRINRYRASVIKHELQDYVQHSDHMLGQFNHMAQASLSSGLRT